MKLKPIVPVVIDTNILVPSLYRNTHIFEYVLSGSIVPIWNNFIYNEAKEIINRLGPRYHGINPNLIIDLLDLIFDPRVQVPDMPDGWPHVSPDRNDDPFLFAAEAGKAEYIISHDRRHMIILGHFKGIPIGEPKNFFKWAIQNHPMENSR